MTIDLTSLVNGERGQIAHGLSLAARANSLPALNRVADAVATSDQLTPRDLDGLTDTELRWMTVAIAAHAPALAVEWWAALNSLGRQHAAWWDHALTKDTPCPTS